MNIDYLKTLFLLNECIQELVLFKKRVLSSAIEEINKYSDLYIDIDFILNGRKIEKVKFYISKNKQIKDDTEIKTLTEVDIEKKRVQRLLSVGLSNYEIQFILMDYKVIHIDKVLDSCESEIQSVDTPKIFVKKLLEESSKELDEPSLLPWSYQPKIEKLIESEKLLFSNNKVLDIKKLSEQINLDKKMIEIYNQQVKRKNVDLLSYDKI